MATPKKETLDSTAVAVAPEQHDVTIEPTVSVFIPLAEDNGSDITVDQTETVVINGKVTRIRRGEYVSVKVPVFLQLRNRYPNI